MRLAGDASQDRRRQPPVCVRNSAFVGAVPAVSSCSNQAHQAPGHWQQEIGATFAAESANDLHRAPEAGSIQSLYKDFGRESI